MSVPHGSASTYNNHGCRCERCRAAWNDYKRHGASVLDAAAQRLEAKRRKEREAQRRRRAKRYAAGLTAAGKPIQRPELSAALRRFADHPPRCVCYDCLWNQPVPHVPTVHHFAGAR